MFKEIMRHLETCLIDSAMQSCTYLTHCCNYHWKDTDAKGYKNSAF